MPKIRKLIMALLIIAILVSAAILILNLDVAVRTYHALETGTFSIQRLRYDMASFNFGQKAGVTPIATKVSDKDGMVQVFVPAGEFSMGKIGEPDKDSPQHEVNLDAFWMDQVEVSNAMYEKCVDANGCTLPAIRVNPYYSQSPGTNLTGPQTGTERSLRSGAYDADVNEILTTSRYKHAPQSAGLSRGFRCAEPEK